MRKPIKRWLLSGNFRHMGQNLDSGDDFVQFHVGRDGNPHVDFVGYSPMVLRHIESP